MNSRIHIHIGIFILLLAITCQKVVGEIHQENNSMTLIRAIVEKIKIESTPAVRTKLAQQLSDLIKCEASSTIDVQLINDITALLTDRDDSIRYWSATSLGYLGPRANIAIPALQKALKERTDDFSSKSSASAIRLALKRIRGDPKGSIRVHPN